MDSLAGLALDFIDDPGIIKDVQIPDQIKKAASDTKPITSRDFNSMSENDFGVVFLTKHGHHIPKYPIHDEFHTWAATVAFDKTAAKLPPAARRIAATFIKRACEIHGVDYPSYMDDIADDQAWSNIYDMNNPPKLASEEVQMLEETLLKNMSPAQRVAFRDRQDLSGNPSAVGNPEAVMAALSVPAGPRAAANQDTLEAHFDIVSGNPHAELDAEAKFLQELQGTKTAGVMQKAKDIMLDPGIIGTTARGTAIAGTFLGGKALLDRYKKKPEGEGESPKVAAAPSSEGEALDIATRNFMASLSPQERQKLKDTDKATRRYTAGGALGGAIAGGIAGYKKIDDSLIGTALGATLGAITGGAGLGFGHAAVSEDVNLTNRFQKEYEKQMSLVRPKTASVLLSENLDSIIQAESEKRAAANATDDDYALVIDGERFYPLHTPKLVKRAFDFFSENCENMAPAVRNQFGKKLASKAREIAPSLRKYASSNYGNELESQLYMRKQCLTDKVAHQVLDVLYEKRASMSPGNFAANLEQFDREYGLDQHWDRHIYDPYAATFAEKVAEIDYFYEQGDMSVTGSDLRKLAEDPTALRGVFDQEIVDEFVNDPVAIFSSMPNPQKEIMMKAAHGKLEKNASVVRQDHTVGTGSEAERRRYAVQEAKKRMFQEMTPEQVQSYQDSMARGRAWMTGGALTGGATGALAGQSLAGALARGYGAKGKGEAIARGLGAVVGAIPGTAGGLLGGAVLGAGLEVARGNTIDPKHDKVYMDRMQEAYLEYPSKKKA